MSPLEKRGVQLVAQDYEKFVKALGFAARAVTHLDKTIAQFTTNIVGETKEAEKSTNEFTNALIAIAKKGQMLPGVLGKVSGGVAGMSQAFSAGAIGAAALGTALGVGLVVGLNAALKLIGSVITKIKDMTLAFSKAAVKFVADAAMLGGRFAEMELAAIAVGRGIGLTDDAIRKAIKSVADMNIRYDVAAASVMRLARLQIDLKYATDLVRIAQAIGVETGTETSEQMTAITHALTTNNTQMLRRHGIIVENDIAERRYAEANGLVVDSLTRRQKIEATVQEVIRQSVHLMGVYEAALLSGAKLMRSIEDRLFPEFVAALGAPMQGAFSAVTRAIFDFLTALNASIKEGGRFYPTMVKIGAVLQIAGEHIASFINNFTEMWLKIPAQARAVGAVIAGAFGPEQAAIVRQNLDETGKGINDWFSDLAIGAFEWGAKIMEQFAHGLAAGLRFVAEAMLLVAQVLGNWLAPGSPPKVAPDIIKWGAATMAEYLRGFAMVDYTAFAGIQSVLTRLFSGPKLAKLLGFTVEAISGGAVPESFFKRIAKAAGAYGAEIVKLARLQFAYADAVRAVEAAQKALNEAQGAVEDHSMAVDDLVREYNDLLKAGASDEILDAKLAEVNASERARNAAIIERDEAQEAIKLAEDKLEPIKEALDLQQKLVSVLLDIAAAQADVEKATKKVEEAAKGAGEALLEEFTAVGAGVGDAFSTAMQDAINGIKEDIEKRLKDIFAPVYEAFFGKAVMGPPFYERGEPTGGTVLARIGGVVQAFEQVSGAFDTLRTAFEKIDLEKLTADVGGWVDNMEAMGGPIGQLISLLDLPTWDELVKSIQDLADALKWMRENSDWLFPMLSGKPVESGAALAERLGISDALGGVTQWLAPGVEEYSAFGQGTALGLFTSLVTGLKETDWGEAVTATLAGLQFAFGIRSPATTMFPVGTAASEGIAAGMVLPDSLTALKASAEALATELLVQAQDEGSDLYARLKNVGKAFDVAIADGIEANVGKIISALDKALKRVQNIIGAGTNIATGGLPSLGVGRQQGGYSPYGGRHHPGEYIIPAGLTRALMQPVSHTNNIQVGPNNISQSIDQAYLLSLIDSRIRRAVASAY